MDELLTPLRTTYLKARDNEPLLVEFKASKPSKKAISRSTQLGSPEEALEVLKNEPDYDALIAVLRFLTQQRGDFALARPGPLSSQITQVLVADIAPNYWALFRSTSPEPATSSPDLALFLASLRTIGGINAITVRLKALIQEHKARTGGPATSDIALHTDIFLQLLASILEPEHVALSVWSSAVDNADTPAKRRPLTRELVTLLASGRTISVAAEAEDILKKDGDIKASHWVASGLAYSKWLGHSLVHWARNGSTEDAKQTCAEVLTRSLRLGYPDALTKILIEDLLLQPEEVSATFVALINRLSQLEQRTILHAVLKHLAEILLKSDDTNKLGPSKAVSAAAGVIARITKSADAFKTHLITSLTQLSGAGVGDGVGIRRAMVAVFADDRDSLATILEKSVDQFGDQLYIKHSPMLQQEAHAQVLLLAAGYIHRLSPLKLALVMRSTAYLHMISNRIGATQLRGRFLGMVVGETLSALSDKGEKKLNFDMEETTTEEALWYKSLVKVADEVGPVEPVLSRTKPDLPKPSSTPKAQPQAEPKAGSPKPKPARASSMPKPGFIIEELDSSDDEAEDLVPYAKPSSDPEDSDDDPTLVSRDKPRAPVYVRDLILYLRDTDSYDKQKLALTTAPTLIRRKANFGTEVAAHADELASQLVGLHDNFDMDDFHRLRIDSMVALVAAQPKTMAPWFAKTFFDGDFSLSQRAAVLVVLGLAAREIAGFDRSEYADAAAFPSKRLPERIEKLYLEDLSAGGPGRLPGASSPSGSSLKPLPHTAIDTIAQSLTASFLAPIAAEAADNVTGPDALKLSSFTSRANASKAKTRPRVRAIPNTTASLLATSFFGPLTARLQVAMRTHSSRTGERLVFEPNLLATYLKTLAVVLHAAGPSTLALPQMTAEMWHLLLAIRGRAAGEPLVTHAVLVAFAATLEVNELRMRDVCTELGREVVETQDWVASVFEGTRAGDGGTEEAEIKMLAAAVLIKLREAVEKYRLLLLGDMIGYT